MTREDLPSVNRLLKAAFRSTRAPIIDLVAAQTRDPFRVLLGTILSARTKDACTAAACKRLFARAATPDGLRRIPQNELERLIYPVGFYRDKARHLKALPDVLAQRFGGTLPDTVEALCELPGVGRKTANLVVALGFNKPAICVDVHVHRITNRLGLVDTKTPFETEMALRELLPVRYWKTWNSYLVAFGQTRCLPRNPRCDGCPLAPFCPSCAK
ncbi:MAG: endonuclease III [Kiritimatiellia bacterium]|jgi:endonuclease III|nr:endonuclease III [Kiritimatiellia bacterium]